MRRNLAISLILTVIGCTPEKKASVNINEPNQLEISENLISDSLSDDQEFNTEKERVSFDSLHYSIIRRWYSNGNLRLESVTDNNLKIIHWSDFHNNGNLKKKGIMSTGVHYYIGKWTFNSENGITDSIVNYDLKQPISYYEALRIAENQGFLMPNIEIEKLHDEHQTSWRINRWTEKTGGNGRTAETILIDMKTGKVTNPEYIIESVY